jgi:subfamily B ATP-binding cassette protein MsbA
MAGNFFTAVRRGMCVALLAGSLGACAGGLGGNKEVPLDELPPEEIYKRGELTLETARKPGDSLRYFAEVERLYPYTEWAKRGLIMQAFVLHKSKEYEEARVAAVVARRQKYLIKGSNARSRAAPVTEFISMTVVAAVFAYAGWRAQSGGFSAGHLLGFILALMMAGQSLRQLANLRTIFAEGATAARRLFAAMDVEPEVVEPKEPRALPADTAGHIRLEDVTFTYAGGSAALDGVTLEARRGEMVALVGPSGGGKSTVLSLIPRFYDVAAGAVTIDGVDVRQVAIADLRERIALVTQEPFLFDDTIRANIAYARPDATDAEVEDAARRAAAHDFISAFAAGYDTQVGEAASRLSGGQRQRIAIARAFLKDAPILLLDEATSALDTESEAQVQVALERLMAGRTTIVIAHRLSTVLSSDMIVVMSQGRIIDTGTHAELLEKSPAYRKLYEMQFNHEPATPGS